jgi:hypothetical protein
MATHTFVLFSNAFELLAKATEDYVNFTKLLCQYCTGTNCIRNKLLTIRRTLEGNYREYHCTSGCERTGREQDTISELTDLTGEFREESDYENVIKQIEKEKANDSSWRT